MTTATQPDPRIPVIVLSGFLGSGKTTLLNRLLSHYPRSAIIINEFGTTPIDQQLLREHNMPISTLAGGCLCCQVIGSLSPLLKNLRMAWEAKPDKPFDRIFIETSGVANPEPVLDTLLRERWLAARYRLEGMIATVSAVNGAETLSRFPEAQAQVAWADTLVVTQTDLATTEQTEALLAYLQKFAPATPRLQAIQGEIDPQAVFAAVKPVRYRLKPELSIPEHPFYSISLQLEQPIVWERLQPVLEDILQHYAGHLIRLKGLVYTADDNLPLLVQAADCVLFPPVRLMPKTIENARGCLVLITNGKDAGLSTALMESLRSAQLYRN
ncbi:GTP-binding protein [Methylosoma difficile]